MSVEVGNRQHERYWRKPAETWFIHSLILVLFGFPWNVFSLLALLFSLITIRENKHQNLEKANKYSGITRFFVIIATGIFGCIILAFLLYGAIIFFFYIISGGDLNWK